MSQKQILIVEDNGLNREILKEILDGEYRVLEAENGQMALDILKMHRNDIDLILLDVMMPVMDGYEFLDKIKKEEELALIPVIVMTQSDSEADEISALVHGASDFVPKPYRPKVILHRIAAIIKLRETAAIVNLLQNDHLTGLYSKEYFYQKVREKMKYEPQKKYTIVCSNIENFKLYNDNYGVAAGDELLRKMASMFKMYCGKDAICGRFGADRFLCLQESEKEQQDRNRLSECMNNNLEGIVMKWGIYEITDPSVPVEQMCDRAILAVDSIKGQYHRHFAVYDDALRERLLREKAITDSMEAAIKEKQFSVYYQPKYSLKENCMAGAEALVRWIHPQWGFMSPGEFIPLFEKNGFIPHLDFYVWEQVCIQMKEWREKGYPLLPVSVNVSRADVYQANLEKIFEELVLKYDIEPQYLHLEITESVCSENAGQMLETINRLCKKGFIVEMDDFGSGYSSLNMLNQIKMDIIKLDMQFIRNEMAKPAEQSILRYVVDMCHGIGLRVVAEGVETREQTERLREIECDYVQGYYFARPMPAKDFSQLLKKQSVSNMNYYRYQEKGHVRRNILVVDENAGYRARVRKTLEGRYSVREAFNPEGALEEIQRKDEAPVSVVILSMTLPENGAEEMLRIMRENPVYWKIPVLSTLPGGEMAEQFSMAMETDDFLCKCHPQKDLLRRVDRLVGILSYQEREDFLQDEAGKDYLTGLLNRRGFQYAMDSLQKEDLPLVLCLFDLDDLKKVNDTSGHDAGDRLIQSFADLLRRHTRARDILCRHGGDEFIVVLKQMGSREDAVKKATNICKAFQASCSAGIVLWENGGIYPGEMIRRADKALYRAKSENKGGCCLWDE